MWNQKFMIFKNFLLETVLKGRMAEDDNVSRAGSRFVLALFSSPFAIKPCLSLPFSVSPSLLSHKNTSHSLAHIQMRPLIKNVMTTPLGTMLLNNNCSIYYDDAQLQGKLHGSADFKGPGANRGCTDVLCGIMLIACWVSMTGVGLTAMGTITGFNETIPVGNPKRLTNGMDYQGHICGIDDYVLPDTGENIKDLPKAYYLPSGAPVCVKECPTKDTEYTDYFCKYDLQKKITDASNIAFKTALASPHVARLKCAPYVETIDAWGYCVPQAALDALAAAAAKKMNEEIVKDCLTTETTYDGLDNKAVLGTESDYVSSDDTNKYWKNTGETTLGNNCTKQRKGDVVTAEYMDPTSEDGFFDRANADMYTARYVIGGCGSGVALILGFLYLYILRIPGVLATVCWGLIFGIEVALLGTGFYAYSTSESWKEEAENFAGDEAAVHPESDIKSMLYVSYVFVALGAIWLCVICCLRKRIVLAIGMVKEACKAVACMPVITAYPVFQVLGALAFLVPWCYYMVYLVSGGDVVADCICPSSSGSPMDSLTSAAAGNDEDAGPKCDESCFIYKSFSYSMEMKLTGLYMLFCWFWTSQFIIAAGQLVVAMSIATWYFTRDKKTVGNGTFFTSMKRAMFYHLGTAAFGSLVIAIIKTIRVIIAYIQNKTKKSKSEVLKAILCAIQCYMWCLEKCMKFLNKNAYIQVSLDNIILC